MPLTGQTITWARPRVQNFSEGYAHKLIRELVALDGQVFDKVRFFGILVEKGVLNDPSIPTDKTKDEIYAKRWDSYLAPIRPFGLGFNVEEKRTNSPNSARNIWRVSDVARLFDMGDLDHREFMALQLARTQFPKITMPLKDPAKRELQAGAAIQPLRLFVEVADGLTDADQPAHLTHDEICQLPRSHTHADVADVVAEISAHRTGGPTPAWIRDEPADLDILINDLNATGFFRRLTTAGGDQPLLVPSYARFAGGRQLVAEIDWIDVMTGAGIESYYERLMAAPTDQETKILERDEQVIRADTSEMSLNGEDITGPAHIVGGLMADDEVFVVDAGRLVRVVTPATTSALHAGSWHATARVEVAAFVP